MNANGCAFTAEITTDFADGVYSFVMNCSTDAEGNMQFEVIDPEEIGGITGLIGENGGSLLFDDTALAFPPLSDRLVSPVSAPWLLIKALRGGYIHGCSMDNDLFLAIIGDSYEEESLEIHLWLDAENAPINAEIVQTGSKIVSLKISNFVSV